MKKILLSFAVVAVAGAAYVGVKATSANSKSSLLVQNVEAMAQIEEGGAGTGWIRTDGDCEYRLRGEVHGSVTFNIAGIGIVKVKAGADGYATYIYGGGKTECDGGGNSMCEARYCPPLL